MTKDLPGREIESAAYTGLIERLSQINAVASVVAETHKDLDQASLANMIVQIGELATEAIVFAGATQKEAMDAFQAVLGGLSFGAADQ